MDRADAYLASMVLLLLLRLLESREMYGYELVRSIREATGEAISLGEGVIYPVLHGLERTGSLKARRKPVGGRTRVTAATERNYAAAYTPCDQ